METDDERLNEVTRKIIGAAFQVCNTLGPGFLEKVYENALSHELRKTGLNVRQQHPIRVFYDGVVIGEYVADIMVEDLVIVEIKAIKMLEDIHSAQCINYLKATRKPVGLLLNFAQKVDVKRFRF
jgi:GxxExxY protein